MLFRKKNVRENLKKHLRKELTPQRGFEPATLRDGDAPANAPRNADSPAGLADWLIDHGDGDAQPAAAI